MSKKITSIFVVILFFLSFSILDAKTKKKSDTYGINSQTLSALKLRGIGPSLTSGRIADFAVNPEKPWEYYVGVASGNIWKTVNNGITWKPVFEKYKSYSIGCLAMDPRNHNIVWAGTGENNSQRALAYGDGVYKTVNGGKSWKNMGLKDSRQIGKIIIHPKQSDTVYVAAEGSVWGPGGERGLYKTTDGGKTWKLILKISKDTGVSDLAMDPRNPDVIYAASHQRRRHVFTKIDGGPESGIHKTTDGGKTWKKLGGGLPSGNMGSIGLAISSVNPDYIYAIIEAAEKRGGFFRSINKGQTWQKMSSHVASSPQYYNEIFCDPVNVDKVFSVETVSQYTLDGGKTWIRLGLSGRHVDDHALWINPANTNHLMIGGDGGIYESYDHGKKWLYKCNLPITQFYRVAVDNSKPFYYVYGGTQDNNSMGGPSRNTSAGGVTNSDWFITCGGDGFWQAIDPVDPNIVYSESQYGGLVRYDRKSGESISIKPIPPQGEAYTFNWNAPMKISPHSHKRLYFGANKLLRSDDYGNTWIQVSPDLTQKIDRNQLKVMGKLWSPEAVAKNVSTSMYGAIVSFDESRLLEGLLYCGLDDGIIQISEDSGKNWGGISQVKGVPANTYVSSLFASKHDANVVYASFDNRKRDDFKPYIFKSADRGKTWQSIANNLPADGTVHDINQDHVDKNILFAGTEFGLFVSLNGGKNWVKMTAGIPTIAVRHIAIQERENDLVLATFGRGFYILDNYAPLRHINRKALKKDVILFPVKDAKLFHQTGSKYGQGATYYSAKNPAYGAVFTYYLKNSDLSLKQKRKKEEKNAKKLKKDLIYPTFKQLREEDIQESAYLLFTVTDKNNDVIRRIKTSMGKGIKRIVWNLRYPSGRAVENGGKMFSDGRGVSVIPGTYTVAMGKVIDGNYTKLTSEISFKVVAVNDNTLAGDRKKVLAFQQKAKKLYRIVNGTSKKADEIVKTISAVRTALSDTPEVPQELLKAARNLDYRMKDVMVEFNGNPSISRRQENQPPSVNRRVRSILYAGYGDSSHITTTALEQYQIVNKIFPQLYEKLQKIINELKALENKMEAIGVPWTPGRLPKLK